MTTRELAVKLNTNTNNINSLIIGRGLKVNQTEIQTIRGTRQAIDLPPETVDYITSLFARHWHNTGKPGKRPEDHGMQSPEVSQFLRCLVTYRRQHGRFDVGKFINVYRKPEIGQQMIR